MLAVKGAVFAAFQTTGGFLTVFFGGVVAAAAFSAGQRDDFSCHGLNSFIKFFRERSLTP